MCAASCGCSESRKTYARRLVWAIGARAVSTLIACVQPFRRYSAGDARHQELGPHRRRAQAQAQRGRLSRRQGPRPLRGRGRHGRACRGRGRQRAGGAVDPRRARRGQADPRGFHQIAYRRIARADRVVDAARHPHGLLRHLCDRRKRSGQARHRGGKDNVTAVCLSIEADEDEETSDVEGKTEVLRRIPLFQHMTYKELLSILGIARGRQFEKGQSIIKEGEQGDELYVLFRGKVDVLKSGLKIATLKAGGHFGEMGLVDQAPRSATVSAVEDTSAISIDRDSLLKLMRRDALLAVKLLWSFVQVLSERLRNTNDALTTLNMELDRIRAKTTDPALESIASKKSGPPPFGQ